MDRAVAHLPVGSRAAAQAHSWRLNWRLIVGIGVNVALWWGIIAGLQSLGS